MQRRRETLVQKILLLFTYTGEKWPHLMNFRMKESLPLAEDVNTLGIFQNLVSCKRIGLGGVLYVSAKYIFILYKTKNIPTAPTQWVYFLFLKFICALIALAAWIFKKIDSSLSISPPYNRVLFCNQSCTGFYARRYAFFASGYILKKERSVLFEELMSFLWITRQPVITHLMVTHCGTIRDRWCSLLSG